MKAIYQRLALGSLLCMGLVLSTAPCFAFSDQQQQEAVEEVNNKTVVEKVKPDPAADAAAKAKAKQAGDDAADDYLADIKKDTDTDLDKYNDKREDASDKAHDEAVAANNASKGPNFSSQGVIGTGGSFENQKEAHSTIAYPGVSKATQLMQLYDECVVIDNNTTGANKKTFFVPANTQKEWDDYKAKAGSLSMLLRGVCRSIDLPKLCNEYVSGDALLNSKHQDVYAGNTYTAQANCSAGKAQCGVWTYTKKSGNCCPDDEVHNKDVKCPTGQTGKIHITVGVNYDLKPSSPGCTSSYTTKVDTSDCKRIICPGTKTTTATQSCPSGQTGNKVTITTTTYKLKGNDCVPTTTSSDSDNCRTNTSSGGGGNNDGYMTISWHDNGDGTHTTTISNINSNGSTQDSISYTKLENTSGQQSAYGWSSSDIRLKEKVADLDEAKGLDTILKLRPVTWHWRDVAQDKLEGEQVGFIAQEVAKEFPSLLINTGKDITLKLADGTTEVVKDSKALDYAKLTAPLVKAVQELKAENDKNAAAIKDLAAQFEAYKATHK